MGSTTSLIPSPSRLKPRVVTAIASPGKSIRCGSGTKYRLLSDTRMPHSAVPGAAPSPMNDSPDADRMVPPMSRVKATRSGAHALGRMCLNIILPGGAPTLLAASTKLISLTYRTCPLISLA